MLSTQVHDIYFKGIHDSKDYKKRIQTRKMCTANYGKSHLPEIQNRCVRNKIEDN